MVGGFDFGLGSDDSIKLYNAVDELVVQVAYSDNDPWALNGDETGRTLELLHYTQELSESSVWFMGCFKGSPGTSYNENCESGLSTKGNLISERKIIAYPIPAEDQVHLSVYLAKSEANVQIEIYDLAGRRVKRVSELNLNSGSNIINVDLKGLNNQLYILLLNTSKWSHRIKLLKK